GAFAARKRGVVFGEPRLRPLPGQVLRPVMQHSCAEIGAQIAAMAPDRAVVHESVFEKYRLARAHIVAGEDGLPGCIHGARGYGRRVLIGLERQKDQYAESENECQRDGARPPRRKLFDGFVRLCAGHDAPDPVARFTNKIDPRPRHRKALRQGSAALSPENEYERPLRDSRRPFLPAKVRVKSGGVPPSRPGDSALQYDDVVLGRRSIRGYKPDPVPKALIREVIEIAMRAPSSLNTQPWNFYVVAGEPLDRIRAGNTERNLAGVPHSREFRSHGEYVGVHRERQIEIAKQLFAAMNIVRHDKA